MPKKQITLYVDGVDDRRIVDQDGQPVTIDEARRLWADSSGQEAVGSEYGTGGESPQQPRGSASFHSPLATRHSPLTVEGMDTMDSERSAP